MLGTTRYITLEAAKAIMAAGEAEARKNGWNVCIAIVDASGGLIMFQKLDDTQNGSIAVSQGKTAFLSVEGIVPLQGGVPVTVDGKVIGAVGVSGVTSAQDEQVAIAAVSALQ